MRSVNVRWPDMEKEGGKPSEGWRIKKSREGEPRPDGVAANLIEDFI